MYIFCLVSGFRDLSVLELSEYCIWMGGVLCGSGHWRLGQCMALYTFFSFSFLR